MTEQESIIITTKTAAKISICNHIYIIYTQRLEKHTTSIFDYDLNENHPITTFSVKLITQTEGPQYAVPFPTTSI